MAFFSPNFQCQHDCASALVHLSEGAVHAPARAPSSRPSSSRSLPAARVNIAALLNHPSEAPDPVIESPTFSVVSAEDDAPADAPAAPPDLQPRPGPAVVVLSLADAHGSGGGGGGGSGGGVKREAEKVGKEVSVLAPAPAPAATPRAEALLKPRLSGKVGNAIGGAGFVGGRRIKRYVGATPSAFCHLCRRSERSLVRMVTCYNIQAGLCRKVTCEKCFAKQGWNFEEASRPSSQWVCTHCSRACPSGAQCFTYEKINRKRGLKSRPPLEAKSDLARTTCEG